MITEPLLKTMRRILWVVATCLGGMGVMAVWGSFRHPDCGFDAVVMLSTATFIQLGVPPTAPAARRRFPPGSEPPDRASPAARLRRLVAICSTYWRRR